jgi:hypothetical protein
MRGVKQVFGWLVTVVLLAVFMAANALGSEMDYEPRAIVMSSVEPVKIGEKAFVPVEIRYSPKWKSAEISLEIKGVLNSIKTSKIELDSTMQAPYTAYIPVTVTKEGLFDIKGNITVEAPDGEKFRNGENSWSVPIGDLGIFAFEGEVFFGGSSGMAMEAAAVRDLQKTNSEYNKLLNKKESIDKGTLKQTFSVEDNEKLKKLRDDAIENVYKKYFDRYPIKTESPSILFNTAPSSKPQKGETVNLEVNWLIDSTCISFCTYMVV